MNRREVIALAAATLISCAERPAQGQSPLPQPTPSPSPPPSGSQTAAIARFRRVLRVGPAVQEFGSVSGPVSWSPDGASLCVELASRSADHVFDVYATKDWSRVSQFEGSRPVWSADSSMIAVVRPSATSVPPPPETTVVVLDALTGTERDRAKVPASSIGWSNGRVFGVIGGGVAPMTDPGRAVVTCPGGCATATWSRSNLVAVSGTDAATELHDVTRSPTLIERLGRAASIVWATSASALGWSAEGTVRSWSPNQGVRTLPLPAGFKPVAWSPRGELLVCVDPTGAWKQWHAEDNVVSPIEMPGDLDLSGHVLWSPDGRFVAAVPSAFSASRVRIHPVTADSA